jgi:hypothetical protein
MFARLMTSRFRRCSQCRSDRLSSPYIQFQSAVAHQEKYQNLSTKRLPRNKLSILWGGHPARPEYRTGADTHPTRKFGMFFYLEAPKYSFWRGLLSSTTITATKLLLKNLCLMDSLGRIQQVKDGKILPAFECVQPLMYACL